jgi:DNA-binding CsgD family transcriptional regulator
VDAEQEWLDLVAAVLATPLTALPEERLATALTATFDSPVCAFHSRPAPAAVVQRIYPAGLVSAARQAEWVRLAKEVPGCHPLLNYYLCTRDTAPQQVVDVPAVFLGPPTRGWVELSRCHGYEHQLAIPLPTGVDGPRWFVLGRADPFPAERMQLARRVQRLIVGLDRQAAVLRSALMHEPGRVAAVGASTVATDVQLTPRELAVLSLVADGLTSAAAARRLVVAERTVHKHLERVYTKLDVSDRVSAVVRAQRLGVLPVPEPAAGRRGR